MMVLLAETLPLPEPEKVRVLAPKRTKGLGLRSWRGLSVAVKKGAWAADVVETCVDVNGLLIEGTRGVSPDGRAQIQVIGASDLMN